MKIIIASIAIAAASAALCTPSPAPSPPAAGDASTLAPSPPAPGTSSCTLACADMAQMGCREGADPWCTGTMAKLEGDRLTRVTECPDAASCYVSCDWCRTAKTPAEVVARCGTSCTPTGAARSRP